MIDEETMRYKKKSQKTPPAKAKHKHEYVNCVFGFDRQKFSKERGFYPVSDMNIGTYCPICGKIGTARDSSQQWMEETRRLFAPEWNEAAKREFDPTTRTLPYFWLDDTFSQKFVSLPHSEEKRGQI